MSNIKSLRPVTISKDGNKQKGFFHRFVYQMYGNYSETKVLVELDNGKLRYFDPYFVQFSDREQLDKPETKESDNL
ncbi:MAG: hypothetical protein CMB80_33585 [Flammeovirgaceae bacterium]|nr:hypothetical protein [Flammeovirgaceae bacterium]MBR07611.1 hypothetical protein [Rickettsiales bacterium]|tara:strand:- start:16 stop:243 length:228 start_codon:yes stop_codon:yes gene_type:complete